MNTERFPFTLFLLLCVACCGCGSSRNAEFVAASNNTNIKKMGSAYQLFASRSNYKGPDSIETLKDFLKTDPGIVRNLELIGMDREKLDEYFVSENDGKEFVFRWGVFVNPDRLRATEPIVFEQEGKDGIRLVMLTNRKVLEVDSDRKYNELLKGKVNKDDLGAEQENEGYEE